MEQNTLTNQTFDKLKQNIQRRYSSIGNDNSNSSPSSPPLYHDNDSLRRVSNKTNEFIDKTTNRVEKILLNMTEYVNKTNTAKKGNAGIAFALMFLSLCIFVFTIYNAVFLTNNMPKAATECCACVDEGSDEAPEIYSSGASNHPKRVKHNMIFLITMTIFICLTSFVIFVVSLFLFYKNLVR